MSAAIAVTVALASSSGAGRCSKTFTVPMVQRAIDATYAGTRPVSVAQRRRLRRYVRCRRVSSTGRYLHRYWLEAIDAQSRRRNPFTGYAMSGTVSTFGPPLEGASQTADGGDDTRPCIALRDTSTLGRWFKVTIGGHAATLLHCDSGPYAGSRSIDVTGAGDYKLGFDPSSFPTDSYGVARELR